MREPAVTLILPVYNEAAQIRAHVYELMEILQRDGIDFAITLVDDGSQDMTWPELCALAEGDTRIRALRFSRNFGKEAAICAGLFETDAPRYLIMDSDLQHPPRYIKAMMAKMDETGCDIVDGVKESRGRESALYKLCARGYYKLLKWVSGMELDHSSDFKLISRKVVETLRRFGEGRLFFRGLVQWVGFTHAEVPFQVDSRTGGKSTFSMKRRLRFAVDSVLAFTSKPLYITVVAAVGFFIGAVILAVQTLFNYFSGRAVSGFTTVILLLLIMGSVLSLSLAVIGAYISRIFDEVKARPTFIISEQAGESGKEDAHDR